jgi:type III restriction enzyme
VSVVPYDDASVDAIATTLNLRLPNRNALDAIARELDARPEGSELVADLATGVGKTYIAGGLLDYLYEAGVRNVVIVTPGSTIQRKTVANLTPGQPQVSARPGSVTRWSSRWMTLSGAPSGRRLDDDDRFKVFVFTVQSLLRPDTKDQPAGAPPPRNVGPVPVRTTWKQPDDLVVIADEHHVYFNKSAKKFEAAIRT